MKTTILVIAAVAAVIIIAAIVTGNYFINFGLARRKKKHTNEHLLGELPARSDKSDASALNHQEARQEAEAWKHTVAQEKVKILSSDGLTLTGELFFPGKDAREGHKWVILIHGYSGGKAEMKPFAMEYCRRGYMSLCIDCRGHGESEGAFIGMGYLDGKDVISWMNHIISMDPEARIVLHGHSMGGVAVVTACGSNPPKELKAAIADCPFSSSRRMFNKQLKEWFRLPGFPIINVSELIFRVRGGYGFKDAEAIRFVHSIKTPILYIHGDEDKFVPTDMSRELYDATKAPKDIIIFHGAAHAQSQDTDPQGYYKAVFDFIESKGIE
ncbi:MAG: alpha/beta fold hydrolase [Clostridiales bacterium]|nr:alpha/beta fold hydrolase [Clostridiales bacterium]